MNLRDFLLRQGICTAYGAFAGLLVGAFLDAYPYGLTQQADAMRSETKSEVRVEEEFWIQPEKISFRYLTKTFTLEFAVGGAGVLWVVGGISYLRAEVRDVRRRQFIKWREFL